MLSVGSPKMERLWKTSKADLSDLDREDWEDCFEDSTKLLDIWDKLIQTKLWGVLLLGHVDIKLSILSLCVLP